MPTKTDDFRIEEYNGIFKIYRKYIWWGLFRKEEQWFPVDELGNYCYTSSAGHNIGEEVKFKSLLDAKQMIKTIKAGIIIHNSED